MTIKYTRVVQDLLFYTEQYVKSSVANKYKIPFPASFSQDYILTPNSFIRLLFDESWPIDSTSYTHLYIKQTGSCIPSNVNRRMSIYPGITKYYTPDTIPPSGEGTNIFNLTDDDLMMLDFLLDYKTKNPSSSSSSSPSSSADPWHSLSGSESSSISSSISRSPSQSPSQSPSGSQSSSISYSPSPSPSPPSIQILWVDKALIIEIISSESSSSSASPSISPSESPSTSISSSPSISPSESISSSPSSSPSASPSSSSKFSDVEYTDLTTVLSKLIYIYLDFKINDNYSLFDNITPISSSNEVLESFYESFLVELIFNHISSLGT